MYKVSQIHKEEGRGHLNNRRRQVVNTRLKHLKSANRARSDNAYWCVLSTLMGVVNGSSERSYLNWM